MKDFIDSQDRKRRNVIIGIGIAALVLLIAIIVLIAEGPHHRTIDTAPLKPQETIGGSSNTQEQDGGEEMDLEKPFWSDKKYPVEQQQWQKTPYRDQKGKTLDTHITNLMSNIPGAMSQIASLPSRSTGFTDDPHKALIDGVPNPRYSYWTSEGFTENVYTALQRFINPEFGEWTQLQYPISLTSNKESMTRWFDDVYDPAYLASKKKAEPRTWVPIYADWDSNNYGMKDKLLNDGGPRWMGVLENVRTTLTYDKKKQYTAKVVAHVKYSAWAQDQTTLTKHGVITFNVVPGDETHHYNITNSTLEMTT